jgi:transposase
MDIALPNGNKISITGRQSYCSKCGVELDNIPEDTLYNLDCARNAYNAMKKYIDKKEDSTLKERDVCI